MSPIWTLSTEKHGVSRHDAMHAVINATFTELLSTHQAAGTHGGVVTVFIGPRHAQTEDELEILVEHFNDGRESIVFHVQPLSSRWRSFREEHDND
jgi:hypothetical protein